MWSEPELAAGPVTLRPWRLTDAPALHQAWHDPLIETGGQVPSSRSMAAARRWIAGASARAAAGHALDLVIDQDGVCVGEVGVAHLDRRRRAALMGWWVAAGHRGQGLATTAVRTLADWLLGPGGLTAVVAEIDHGNHPSQRTALHAGFVTLRSGGADHPTVLVRRQENN